MIDRPTPSATHAQPTKRKEKRNDDTSTTSWIEKAQPNITKRVWQLHSDTPLATCLFLAGECSAKSDPLGFSFVFSFSLSLSFLVGKVIYMVWWYIAMVKGKGYHLIKRAISYLQLSF